MFATAAFHWQDRKPLTAELAKEDAELEKQANAMCAKLGEEPESLDVVKARQTPPHLTHTLLLLNENLYYIY